MIIRDELDQVEAALAIKNLDLSKPHEIKISEYKSSKSLDQLRLYWKWVGIIAGEYGYHKDDMSEYLKEALIEPRFVDVRGKTKSVRPSISSMKIDEMAKFIDKVSIWAGQQGLNLPHPEDLHNEQ